MEVGGKEEKLPPGFRFHPTDEELITFYLTRKLADSSFTSTAIGDIDLNKCEPWDLPGNAKMGEKEWYFFNLRDRKYPTGLRTNRATDAGYWKTTGKDKEIYASANSELAGMKKTLVFYKGRAPRGEKTNWVMHEYRIQPDTTFKNGKDEWVVCRVFKKNSVGKKLPPNPMRAIPSNLEARSAALSSLLQQDPYDFNLGLSHLANVELMDLSKVSMGSLNTNLFGQPRLALAAAFGQQLPGSNLDLPARRNVLLAMSLNGHDLPLNRELPASTMSSGIMLNPNEMCTGAEFPSGGEACHLVDACRRLGGYWPASY